VARCEDHGRRVPLERDGNQAVGGLGTGLRALLHRDEPAPVRRDREVRVPRVAREPGHRHGPLAFRTLAVDAARFGHEEEPMLAGRVVPAPILVDAGTHVLVCGRDVTGHLARACHAHDAAARLVGPSFEPVQATPLKTHLGQAQTPARNLGRAEGRGPGSTGSGERVGHVCHSSDAGAVH